MPDQIAIDNYIQQKLIANAKMREIIVRELLNHWVSEIPPALAEDLNGKILGLTPDDTPLGVKGFILSLEDCGISIG